MHHNAPPMLLVAGNVAGFRPGPRGDNLLSPNLFIGGPSGAFHREIYVPLLSHC